MKIYVLLKQHYEGSESICVSEDINKIRTSICKDFDAKEDYLKLEILKDEKQIDFTSGWEEIKKYVENRILQIFSTKSAGPLYATWNG